MKDKKYLFALLIGVVSLWLAPLTTQAQTEAKKKVEKTMSEKIEFPAGGTINLQKTWGELFVEGWDQPYVEVTLKKSTNKKYAAKDEAEGAKTLEKFSYTLTKETANSLTLTGVQPSSNLFTRPFGDKSSVKLVYTIKVPRQTNLVIKHDAGVIEVNNVAGDMNINNSVGEVSLHMPEGGDYTVDARSKVGDVSSSARFMGDNGRQHVVGQKLDSRANVKAAHSLFVRVKVGTITIN